LPIPATTTRSELASHSFSAFCRLYFSVVNWKLQLKQRIRN
jgi:hypothetical protein